jgi:hypothetical protein
MVDAAYRRDGGKGVEFLHSKRDFRERASLSDAPSIGRGK